MKRTELEKLQGKKLVERMRREPASARQGTAAGDAAERREQRRRDQAAGLVPFAVKLPAALVADVQAHAKAQARPLGDVVAELLRASLPSSPDHKDLP